MEIRSALGLRPEKPNQRTSKTSSEQKSPKTNTTQKTPSLDTYESTPSKLFGTQMESLSHGAVAWDGVIPSSGTLQITDPNALIRDDIDWKAIEQSYTQNSYLTLDDADSLKSTVNHMCSIYLAAKHRLEQIYSNQEDKLSEGMTRLNHLFDRAKSQMVSSFKSTVGHFYENTGNKELAADMGNRFPDLIDKRIKELETYGNDLGIFDPEKNYPYNFLDFALQTYGFQDQEKEDVPEVSQENRQEKYSLKDLQAAGFVAKAASKMNAKELTPMQGDELGLQMAIRYMKMSRTLDSFGIGEKTASLLLSSFDTFLNQYSGEALHDDTQSSSLIYQYAIKQYESTKDLQLSMMQSARKYMDDSFFSTFYDSGNGTRAAKFTRCMFDTSQFLHSLENSSPEELLQSIAGNRLYPMSTYA